jgi:hypothetical protein
MKNLLPFFIFMSWQLLSCNNSSSSDETVDSSNGKSKLHDSAKAEEIASYANVRTNYYNTSGGGGSTGQVCGQILHDGTMRYFNYSNLHEYKSALKKAITLDESQLNTLDDSKSASLGISLPLAKGLAAFNGDYESDHEEYNELRRKYTDNSSLEISDEDLVKIEQRIGDPNIINAWKECIQTAFKNERGIRAFTSGDEFSDFVLNLNYFPKSQYDPKKVKIASIDFSSNLQKVGNDQIKKGVFLETYTGLAQKFKRLNNKQPAYIKVSVQGFSVETVTLEPFIPPPINPVYEQKWMKVDEEGNQYFQAFVINHPQCWDCSDDDKFIISSQTFTLEDKAGKIYEIKRDCSGSGCGWNYSPVPGAGYADNVKILSATSFFIQRLIKGPPCTETYTAYYEKQRNVCVKNCK